MKYGHGDDLYRYEGKIRHNFSSNIWSHADLSGLCRHLAEHAPVGSYPTPDAHELAEMIEQEKGTVLVTNGATGGIYLLAQLFGGGESLIFCPTFGEYESACSIFGHRIIHAEHNDWSSQLDSFSNSSSERKICWLCNPNNPDGFVYDKALLLNTIRQHPNITFIIDMAYEDYTCAELPAADELLATDNAAVIHSMTKRYCVPGIRLGYVMANSNLISRLERIQQPWAVGQLAIEAGKYLIANGIGNMPGKEEYIKRAEIFRQGIDKEEGYKTCPSSTNFFLTEMDFASAAELKAFLAERHGILIRDASNFRFLTPRHFRIAAQADGENELLSDALREFRHIRR